MGIPSCHLARGVELSSAKLLATGYILLLEMNFLKSMPKRATNSGRLQLEIHQFVGS